MIDPTLLRTDPNRLARSLQRRGVDIDVAMLAALDVFGALYFTNSEVAHLAHVGGMLFGYLFFRLQAVSRRGGATPVRSVERVVMVQSGANEPARPTPVTPARSRRLVEADAVAAEVDRVLDKISAEVPSFGALPKQVWITLGIIELVCTAGLILPSALHWKPSLTVVAAAVLAAESLVFIWVHVQYREVPPIVMSAVLGLLMAFIACGRMVLKPI